MVKEDLPRLPRLVPPRQEQRGDDVYIKYPTSRDVESLEKREERRLKREAQKKAKKQQPWYLDRRRVYPPGSVERGKGNVYGGQEELKPRHHKAMEFDPIFVARNKPAIYKFLEESKIAYTNYYRIYPIKAPPKGYGPYKYKGYVLYIGKGKLTHGGIVKKPSKGRYRSKIQRRYERSLIPPGTRKRRWR